MADVADFRIIRDSNFTLTTAGAGDIDRDFDFNLGTAVQHGQAGLLQCKYSSSAGPLPILVRFRLNGTDLISIPMLGNTAGMVHEVVNTGTTRDNMNNLEIRIIGGTGSVTLSDIILWVQRTV